MERLVYDIETDGLDPSVIHCLYIGDMATKEVTGYIGDEVPAGIKRLENADECIAHNGIKYDEWVMDKLVGYNPKGTQRDTLVLSRLIFTDMKDKDFAFARKNPSFPSNLIGSHALRAWGLRLGFPKDDYAKQMEERGLDPWAEYNDEMGTYCAQDVLVTMKLVELIDGKEWPEESIELEHTFARLVFQQEQNGVEFDEAAAVQLYGDLQQERHDIMLELKNFFGMYYKPDKVFTPKSDNQRFGYVGGAPLLKVKLIEFNPASNDQVADRLQKLYGWKPKLFTPSGKPVVDEAVLKALRYPPIKMLLRYQLLNKRIGQLAEGKQAWLKVMRNGRIFGSVNTNGAVTGRCTHSHPNLAQVPAVNAPFGAQCRALFKPRKGWVIVGADASGLELRCLAHYMGRWDKGAYARVILEGDIHTVNQEAAGLPTRDNAKTFIYGFLYGAGDEKIGKIIGKGRTAGRKLKAKFLRGLPALDKLKKGVERKVKSVGYLTGLDGRKLHIRSAHAALNTLLQSAGALIMKQGLIELAALLSHEGFRHGQEYAFMLNIHDEWQIECKPEVVERIGELMVKAMKLSGEHFEFRCVIDGEYKVGASWADTH